MRELFKKMAMLLIICVILPSCEYSSRDIGIGNSTSEDVSVRVIFDDGSTTLLESKADSYMKFDYDIDTIDYAYAETAEGYKDNLYYVSKYGNISGIGVSYSNHKTMTIKVMISPEIFAAGESSELYLYDENNGIGRYVQTDVIERIRISEWMAMNIEVYGNPSFKLSADELNGYPVSIKVEDNQILIY